MLGSQNYTPTGWVAIVRHSNGQYEELPVESWDHHGNAMIVNSQTGELAPARNMPGFTRLDRAERVIALTSATPGWRVRLDDPNTEKGYFITPVAAWVLTDQGRAHALINEPDLICVSPTEQGWLLDPDDDDTTGQ